MKKSKEIVAEGGLKALHAWCRFIYSCLATVVTVCFRLPVTESNIQESKYCTHIKENSVKKIVNKRLREILVVRNTLSHVPPVPFVRLRVAKNKNVISKMRDCKKKKKNRFVFNIVACNIYILENLSEKKTLIECILNLGTPTNVNELWETLKE